MESPLFRAVATPNRLTRLRLACVVSRGVDKRAVVRNRLRRRTRQWVVRNGDALKLPFDVAIVFKAGAGCAPRNALYEELEGMFRRLGR